MQTWAEVASINRKKAQAGVKDGPLSNRKQRHLKYQRSQRAGGKHGDDDLFLTTMLFGCIVLGAQARDGGEGSREKDKN